jgi:arylformamidase
MNNPVPIDLEAEYDNRARVPDHPAIMARWERDAAAYRKARGARAELGLRYGDHPRQTIDIFHPDVSDDAKPLVLFIHGGYWRSLDPSLFSHVAAGANAHGLEVAMPGYRLCPEVSLAEIIGDLRSACRALHRRRPERPLVACGHSAGGHLAACMLATDWPPAAPDVRPPRVRKGLAISGIFDLSPLLATSVNASLHLDLETAEAASPALWQAPAGAALELWVGETEASEYFRQSRELADRWQAKGTRTSLHVVAGANHFTAPEPLADPASDLTAHLVALCSAALDPCPPLP